MVIRWQPWLRMRGMPYITRSRTGVLNNPASVAFLTSSRGVLLEMRGFDHRGDKEKKINSPFLERHFPGRSYSLRALSDYFPGARCFPAGCVVARASDASVSAFYNFRRKLLVPFKVVGSCLKEKQRAKCRILPAEKVLLFAIIFFNNLVIQL